MYKAGKEQVSVFGLRTQFGGGKTTGFALVYDSPEAMKKFEPHYRLVRVGLASKIEKASRQQRESQLTSNSRTSAVNARKPRADDTPPNRQAAQEPPEDPPRNCEGQGRQAQEGEIDGSHFPFGSHSSTGYDHPDFSAGGLAVALCITLRQCGLWIISAKLENDFRNFIIERRDGWGSVILLAS